MKMLQKILSHGLLIAVIVAAFFIYTNRAELLPNWFGKTETAEVEQVGEPRTLEPTRTTVIPLSPEPGASTETAGETTAASVESAQVAPKESVADDNYRPLEPAKPQAVPGVKWGEAPAPAASEYRPLQNEVTDAPSVAAEETDAGVSETPVETAQAAGEVVEPNVAEQKPVAAEQPVAEQPAAEQPASPEATDVAALHTSGSEPARKPLRHQLDEARQLYWQRDVGAATQAYEALGRDNPRNADVWGEIGNFYYSIQQPQSAGTAYYRTVSLLIDEGETQKARQLLGILYELDADRGRELDARLQQSAE